MALESLEPFRAREYFAKAGSVRFANLRKNCKVTLWRDTVEPIHLVGKLRNHNGRLGKYRMHRKRAREKGGII